MLAIVIACGASIFASAYLVSPLIFLVGSAALVVIALGGCRECAPGRLADARECDARRGDC